MRFPLAIHKDPESVYGVTVPDVPGCFSSGDTIDEAISNAAEAISAHFELLLEDGEPVPQPRAIEKHRDNPDYADAIWAFTEVDLSKLSGKAERVNISLPSRVLAIVDKNAALHNESRSGYLARAALFLIGHENNRSAA